MRGSCVPQQWFFPTCLIQPVFPWWPSRWRIQVPCWLIRQDHHGIIDQSLAIATRCCSPPDSSAGLWPARSAMQPGPTSPTHVHCDFLGYVHNRMGSWHFRVPLTIAAGWNAWKTKQPFPSENRQIIFVQIIEEITVDADHSSVGLSNPPQME